MHMTTEEYFKKITPSEDMLTELKKTSFTKLKCCVRRIYMFTGRCGKVLASHMKSMKSKDDCICEILGFVTSGKYEHGHTFSFDKNFLKKIPAASLEELDLMLGVLGF